MPHATVMWGFVHESNMRNNALAEDIFTIRNGLEAKINKEPWKEKPGKKLFSYPGLEDCFNKYTDWVPLGKMRYTHMDLRYQ